MTSFNDIETLLYKAKYEADRFFSKYYNDRMKKNVFKRIKQEEKSKRIIRFFNSGKKYRIQDIIKIPITIICIISMLIGFSALLFNEYKRQVLMAENASLGNPVSQEMIKLDESDASRQLVDYFKINKPNQGGNNILAVVWDTEHDGNYEMIYSSLFEDSDQPGPVQMISFPSNMPNMAVISSLNNEMQYIHYRVLGYRKNQIIDLMEQNYIYEGEIEVFNGVLKETA